LRLAGQKALEYELKLKIVDVEYLFDTKKVILFHKTDKDKTTPDLKAYRRDLAALLHAEITMRATTPREEAKFCGGLGPCGQSLCCACWLSKPKHVTVKMVKDQGLQISPPGTSGMCGRLKCCYQYEREGGNEDDQN